MKRLEPYLHYLPLPPFDLEKAGHTTAFWGISDRDWCELGAASIFWGISDRDWCKHGRIGRVEVEGGNANRLPPDQVTNPRVLGD